MPRLRIGPRRRRIDPRPRSGRQLARASTIVAASGERSTHRRYDQAARSDPRHFSVSRARRPGSSSMSPSRHRPVAASKLTNARRTRLRAPQVVVDYTCQRQKIPESHSRISFGGRWIRAREFTPICCCERIVVRRRYRPITPLQAILPSVRVTVCRRQSECRDDAHTVRTSLDAALRRMADTGFTWIYSGRDREPGWSDDRVQPGHEEFTRRRASAKHFAREPAPNSWQGIGQIWNGGTAIPERPSPTTAGLGESHLNLAHGSGGAISPQAKAPGFDKGTLRPGSCQVLLAPRRDLHGNRFFLCRLPGPGRVLKFIFE